MSRSLLERVLGPTPREMGTDAWRLPLAYILTPPPRAFLFAVTSAASVLLALFLGFYFELSEPAWAATTAIIVANPVPGQVLEKSIYRILGTLTGVVATIVFVAFFAQTPILFMSAEALWIAACTALSTVLRGFRSYGAVLSGYTAAILGFPSAAAPHEAFQIAVGRGSAILLGIACATLLSVIFLPGESKKALTDRMMHCLTSAVLAAQQALRGGNYRDILQHTATEIAGLPAWIAAAQQETPVLRKSEGRIRSAILAMFDILSAAHALDLHRRRLPSSEQEALRDRYDAHPAGLHASLVRADPVSGGQPAAHVAEVQEALADAGQLADRVVREHLDTVVASMGTALDALAQIETPSRSVAPPLVLHRDWTVAGRNAVRVLIGMTLASVFWIQTAWAGGMNVLIWTGIALALLASRDRQVQATFSFMKGALAAIPVAAVWKFAILPACSGFPLLAVALLPILILSGLLVAGGPDPGFAASFGMITIASIGLSNVETFAFGDFLNTALAEIIGIGIAAWTFYAVLPADLAGRARRLARASLRDLAQLLEQAADPQSAHAFTTRMYDRLSILFAIGADARATEIALDCLGAGDEAIRLSAVRSPPDERLAQVLRDCAELLHGRSLSGPAGDLSKEAADAGDRATALQELVASLASRDRQAVSPSSPR